MPEVALCALQQEHARKVLCVRALAFFENQKEVVLPPFPMLI